MTTNIELARSHGAVQYSTDFDMMFTSAQLDAYTQAAIEQATRSLPAGMPEPVELLNFSVLDDGELRLLSGRKAPPFDCELYSMPDGKKAPPLYTAAQVQAMLAQGLAPGWQAVPVEPTRPMMDAMHSSHSMPVCYRSMLAAAPRPPSTPDPARALLQEALTAFDQQSAWNPGAWIERVRTLLHPKPPPFQCIQDKVVKL